MATNVMMGAQAAPNGGSSDKSTSTRRLGQAYLEHSIAQLESQLARMPPPASSKSRNLQPHRDATSCFKEKQRRSCLLDISVLVYALPLVRQWCRGTDYAEILLPIDALAMLDILKKAEQPLAAQAREAIRWLERKLSPQQQQQHHHHQHKSYNHKRQPSPIIRPQLRVLNAEEMPSWAQLLQNIDLPNPEDHEQVIQEQRTRFQGISLASQTLLRAISSLQGSSPAILAVAIARRADGADQQPLLVQRVLSDAIPLIDLLGIHFPNISSGCLVIEVSESEVEKAARAETEFYAAHSVRKERNPLCNQASQGLQASDASTQTRSSSAESITDTSASSSSFAITTSPVLDKPREKPSPVESTAPVEVWERIPSESTQTGSSDSGSRNVGQKSQERLRYRNNGRSRSHETKYIKRQEVVTAPAPAKIVLAKRGSTVKSLSTAT